MRRMYEQNETLLKSLEASQARIDDLEEKLDEGLQKSLDAIEDFGKQPSRAPKSVTRIVDRQFANNDLNKGIEDSKDGRTLSKSRNKQKILNIMDNLTFEKGLDNEMAESMTRFEASSDLSKYAADKIKKSLDITIID